MGQISGNGKWTDEQTNSILLYVLCYTIYYLNIPELHGVVAEWCPNQQWSLEAYFSSDLTDDGGFEVVNGSFFLYQNK